jgi:hypothetical protein
MNREPVTNTTSASAASLKASATVGVTSTFPNRLRPGSSLLSRRGGDHRIGCGEENASHLDHRLVPHRPVNQRDLPIRIEPLDIADQRSGAGWIVGPIQNGLGLVGHQFKPAGPVRIRDSPLDCLPGDTELLKGDGRRERVLHLVIASQRASQA